LGNSWELSVHWRSLISPRAGTLPACFLGTNGIMTERTSNENSNERMAEVRPAPDTDLGSLGPIHDTAPEPAEPVAIDDV
jgi:hypothetical protein